MFINNDNPDGGLKMIDIDSFSKSPRATWIKKYLDEENKSKWKVSFDIELESFGGKPSLQVILTREHKEFSQKKKKNSLIKF